MYTLVIILDVIFILTLFIFMQGLRWSEDRPALAGFLCMVGVLAMNILLLAIR